MAVARRKPGSGRSYNGPYTKFYSGVAKASVVAVNPTLKEMNEFGFNFKEEMCYTFERDVEGKTIPFVRVDFVLRIHADAMPEDKPLYVIHSIYVEDRYASKDDGTYEVIDAYGNCAFMSQADIKAKKDAFSQTGLQRTIGAYRLAKAGERNLTEFIREYINLPGCFYTDKKTGSRAMRKDLSDCLCRLDNIKELIASGDVSEIRDAIESIEEDNRLNVILGVRQNGNFTNYGVFPFGISNGNRSASRLVETMKRYTEEIGHFHKRNDFFYYSADLEQLDMKDYPDVFTVVEEEKVTDAPIEAPTKAQVNEDAIADMGGQANGEGAVEDDLPF